MKTVGMLIFKFKMSNKGVEMQWPNKGLWTRIEVPRVNFSEVFWSKFYFVSSAARGRAPLRPLMINAMDATIKIIFRKLYYCDLWMIFSWPILESSRLLLVGKDIIVERASNMVQIYLTLFDQ